MTRRQRIVRAPAAVSDLKYHELAALAEQGRLTWSEVSRIIADRVRARHGGDPYAHLRDDDGGWR